MDDGDHSPQLTEGWQLNTAGPEVLSLVCPVSHQRIKTTERNAVWLWSQNEALDSCL